MKIVFSVKSIYPFHAFGGVEKYIYNMARYLAANGIEVEIVAPVFDNKTFKAEKEGVKFTFLRPNISRYLDSSLGRIGEHIFGLSVSRYLADKEFDLLHGVEFTPFAYLHRKERKPAFFHLFYDTYRKKPFADKSSLLKRALIKLLKTDAVAYSLKHAEATLTETPLQCDEMASIFGTGKEKLHDLPVAVDIAYIESVLPKSGITRESCGFGPDDLVLISVNRLVPEKGIPDLIDAFAIVKKTVPAAKLILVGTGYQEKEIIAKAEALGVLPDVKHCTNVKEDELYGYYRISDIYVSPTLQDDYIMSIQEAMVCGLPIVSTGQRWLVHDGENGYLAGKNAPAELASKIVMLKDGNTRRAFGEASKRIVKDYGWDTVVKNLIGLYKNALSKRT